MNRNIAPTMLAILLGAAAILAAPAAAKDKAAKNTVSKFSACATIAADAERLACYDDLASALQTAANSSDDSALTEAQADAFGAENYASKDELNEIERLSRIQSPVASFSVNSSRRLTVTLANGQVWRQLPDDRIIPAPKDGVEHTVTIRRAIFGRYLMDIEPNGRTIRVERAE